MKNSLLSATEKRILRAARITAADLHYTGHNGAGAVYCLYNDWFVVGGTYNGYSRPEIYRDLARRFISRARREYGLA